MTLRASSLGLCLLLAAGSATAAQPSNYVRVDAVSAQFDVLSLDDSSTGLMLTLGSRFTDYIGAELFYADLGEVEGGRLSGSSPLGFSGFSANFDAKVYGAGLNLRYPIGDSGFFMGGQGGIQWFDLSGSYSTGGFPGPIFRSLEQNDAGGYLGIALGYQFTESLDLSARWTRYAVDLDLGNREETLDPELLSVGLEYRF